LLWRNQAEGDRIPALAALLMPMGSSQSRADVHRGGPRQRPYCTALSRPSRHDSGSPCIRPGGLRDCTAQWLLSPHQIVRLTR
jgi:hypothetical protein